MGRRVGCASSYLSRELPRRWELPYDFRKLNKREWVLTAAAQMSLALSMGVVA